VRSSPLKKLILSAVAVLTAMALVASTSTARRSGNHVTVAGAGISSYHWHPKTVTISKGQKVHWSWDSNAAHNVTFHKLGKHSKTRASETYSLRFNKPGTYHFLCTVHGFKGKVVVTN
jgi:plastocyanin